MGFFDKLEKIIEKADKFIDENFSEEVVSNKTVYSQDALISKCENDCSILHDALLSRAQAISKETVKLDWEWSTTGNSTIKEVSDGIYLVTKIKFDHTKFSRFFNFSAEPMIWRTNNNFTLQSNLLFFISYLIGK